MNEEENALKEIFCEYEKFYPMGQNKITLMDIKRSMSRSWRRGRLPFQENFPLREGNFNVVFPQDFFDFEEKLALHVAAAIDASCDAFLTNDLGIKRVTEIKILVLDELELAPPEE